MDVLLAAVDAAARSYQVGVVQLVRVPAQLEQRGRQLSEHTLNAVAVARGALCAEEPSGWFICPALLMGGARADTPRPIHASRLGHGARLAACRAHIEAEANTLYRLPLRPHSAGAQPTRAPESQSLAAEEAGGSLVPGAGVVELVSYACGGTLGRWDIRFATGEKEPPELPDPFDPLPVCPPGMLQGEDGLPLESEDELPDGYPLRISWSGILVDDPGHPEDVIRRIRDVFEVIWGERAEDIYREAIEILDEGKDSLRPWFRKEFFKDHIKRYSKSRRKAPIYWELGTPSHSYAVWLYYHRFTPDTLYRALNEFVIPKQEHEEMALRRLTQDAGPNPTASQRKEIAKQEELVAEVRDFRAELERVAPLWSPDLNDGVIINFAPLWRLCPQNKGWQKECLAVWDKLVAGEYDWAHLAMRLWPERVVPKCAEDRSLAIAHDLEEVFWAQDEDEKWKQREVPGERIRELVEERTKPAVKAALASLLACSKGTRR